MQKKRLRDPEAHRAAILQAARGAFAELGYAKATIREIARRAGVTHGLVMRHFGSKEMLFVAAIPGPKPVDELEPGTPETLPERMAKAYVTRMEHPANDDPFLVLIRSAASGDRAAEDLFATMRQPIQNAYGPVVDGLDAEGRIDLMGALLIGVTFNRYLLKSGALAEMPSDVLIGHLARTLRAILFK
ncbi:MULTISPECIES: TetR family transcriptional regulator [unclassified Nonomuraea]|uniref:TetR/AcrR family transcriptional regulator n=1 Tax=unclassified Nonomuraea TaxID=2593643 RepID=UPI0033EB26B4